MQHATLCYLIRGNPPREILLGFNLVFLFPAKPAWSQVVHAFLATRWDGHPVESTEMIPAWFAIDDIPFEQMWQDVSYWLPRVLAGERIRASFTFKEDNETVDEVQIEPWYEKEPGEENDDASD